MEAEKAELSEQKREVELERVAAREELAHVQQELMDVIAEKRALEASHVLLQEARARLDTELTILQKEKSSALEQLAQVSPSPPPQHLGAWPLSRRDSRSSAALLCVS